MLALGLEGAFLALRSRSWPEVLGHIEQARVAWEMVHRKRGYYPKVRYRYRVRDAEYVGDCIRFGWLPGDRAGAKAMIERYRHGAQVNVHVCPTQPHLSVPKPGISWLDVGIVLWGASLTVFGLYLLFSWLQSVVGDSAILVLFIGAILVVSCFLRREPVEIRRAAVRRRAVETRRDR